MPGDPLLIARPIGPVVDTTNGAWGVATATFTSDRSHRYRLSRIWDPMLPRVNFVMCNPSTADALVLDPTVRRCMGFAVAWGMGSCEVTNIFALRSTDPSALYANSDPIGPDNDTAILSAAAGADLVVAAWGVHGAHRDRGLHVRGLLAEIELSVLRTTKGGHPNHPLYLPHYLSPYPWA